MTSIIHLSDIHIRAGNQDKSRYHEYLSTFKSLFESLSALPSISIIVITGDIFHHKNKLEPYGLELALHLFSGLSSLAPVYIIRGNHDYRQDTPHEHDMITAIMAYNIKNVHYLDKTGTYYHENIGFGLVAIQDTLLYGSTSGISSELPVFPVPSAEYNIALFHGTITGTTLQATTLHGYPIDWFQGFDAILLGDIHLQQINRADKIEYTFPELPHTMHTGTYQYSTTVPWGYPGSLIQQDFGEQLIGHGYIVWNLSDKLIHTFHIHNQYGFLKIRDNQIISPYSLNQLQLPANLKVCTTGNCQDVLDKITANILFIKTADKFEQKEEKENTDIMHINSMDVLIKYIQNVITTDKKEIHIQWQSWLKNPEKLIISTADFPEQLAKKITERSDKIHKAAAKYIDDFERFISQQSITGTLHIHYLQWNWILNYKDGNSYDFDKSMNQISIINAKNGTGKSNFLEIICIALFGEGFPSRENLNYSAGIICDKKPEGFMPSTTIIFSINGTKYKLFRSMRPNTISRLINYEKIILSTIGDTEQIVHQQKGAVHPWIEKNIGSIETYLMTAMLSQNADRDFYTLDKPTQKMLLDRIMSLDHINSLKSFLKEADKYYKYICDLIESYQDGAGGCDPKIIQQLERAKKELDSINTLCSSLRSSWNHIPERELSLLDFDKAQQQYSQWCSTELVDSLPILQTRLSELDKDISEFTGILQKYINFPVTDEGTLTLSKLPKNIIHIEHLHNQLEEHPYFKTHSLHNIQDVDDTFANSDCSQELFQANHDFETWKEIKSSEFSSIQEDVELTRELIQYTADVNTYPSKIANNSKIMKILRKKLLLKRKEKDEHLEKRPNKPTKNNEWLETTSQIIDKYNITELLETEQSLIHSIQHVPLLSTCITNLTIKIADMEKYIAECIDIPFNSKCKACRIQSWKKTQDEYTAELPTLHAELADKQTELDTILYKQITFDITSYESYIQSANELLTSTKNAILLYQQYHTENNLYTEYDEWTTLYEMICTEYDNAEISCDQLELTITQDENTLKQATAKKHSIETQLAHITRKKQEYELYSAELLKRQNIFEENTQKLEYNWYSTLSEYHTYVSHLITFATTHNNELMLEREHVIHQIQSCKEHEEILKKADDLLCIIEAYPHWKEWKIKVEQQQNCMLLVRELETKQGKLGSGINLDEIKYTMSVVSYLSDKFDGYREWLYKEHIAPMIEKQVNTVLSRICEDRPLYLEAEWLDKINTLSWFVRDGTSRPVIEKASGFQRFIVGMATRVAFHQIGFCRIQYDQLFIDEGFTSCDSDNIERVPEFLHGLLKMYNSIYLATHLEELKACSHTQICIQRDANGLSHIAHGDRTEIIEQKKKGRPSKKINVVRSE